MSNSPKIVDIAALQEPSLCSSLSSCPTSAVLAEPKESGNANAGVVVMTSALELRCQLAVLVHFHHDVGAAYKLSINVELWDGWPVGVFLDALPYFGIA